MKDLTVVVTNFRRDQFLNQCLESLKQAKIWSVVVTTSEPTPATSAVLQRWQPVFPDFRVTTIPEDRGNNEAWLRGASLVRTKWLYLLHDDDVLVPDVFKKLWPSIKQQLELNRLPYWPGRVMQGGQQVGVNDPLQGLPPGPHPSRVITERMHLPNAVSISPVLGVFSTAQVRQTLKECERVFTASKQAYYTRPNMMVGNDMLLWLHAAELHPEVYRFTETVSAHGHHPLSETVRAFNSSSGILALRKCYSNTQQYHRTHRYGQGFFGDTAYHVVPGHPTQDPEVIRRNHLADTTWAPAYAAGVVRLAVEPEHTKRNATLVGEKRDMPFVKDVFDYACRFAEDRDWLIFTNRDICVCPEFLFAALQDAGECFYSHRMDAPRLDRVLKPMEVRRLQHYPGADLFAFRKRWWREWRGMMPDMLVGFEAWDSVMMLMMAWTHRASRADYTPIIYHEWHESHWEVNKLTTPGQKHNRRMAKNFLATRHGYRGDYE